jgi:hypothetical protein
MKETDNDFFEGGNYYKGGDPSQTDGGPALLDVITALKYVESGQTVGCSRSGEEF